jgi:protein O-mannosyl-transferase
VARKPARPQVPLSPGAPLWVTPRGAALIVAVLAVIGYARSLRNDFSYDEGLVIARAMSFLRGGSLATLFSRDYFAATFEGTWRPVCTLTYMLDAAISTHPWVFKATNLVWHLAAAWLLMALARRVLPETARRYAIVAGAILALHPVTTETVDNASFREDALVAVFTMATLILAIDGRRVWSLVAFGLGLLSKESAVVAPALLAMIRLGRVGDDPRPRLADLARELAPYAALAVAYLALRFGPMNIPIAYARYPGGTFLATLAALPAIWTHHLRMILIPWPLCADLSGYFQFGPQPWLPFAGAIVVLLGYAAAIAVAARTGHRAIAFGLGWFAIALLPVSNLLPIPIPAAERFLYLPLAGIALAAAAGFAHVFAAASAREQRAWLAAGAVVGALWIVALNVRHRDWRNDQALWRATLAQNPQSCGAHSAVDGSLLSRGLRTGDAQTLRQAAAHQETALALCPDDADVVRTAMVETRLGAARALLGELPAARDALERATRLAPRYGLGFAWAGYVAYREGDLARAGELLKHAVIDLGPPDATTADVAGLYLDKL